MTAEDVLRHVFLEEENSRFADYPYNDTFDATILSMKEYAKIKCQELLTIVAEKAEVKTVTIPNGLNIKTCVVDKDSILAAVDLDEFID